VTEAPRQHTDPEALAQAVVEQVGERIVLGLPLGIGKANHIVNALFHRAARDPAISLTIFTALTPEVPRAPGFLGHRFLDPVKERLFAGYVPLAYADALRRGALPANVTVNEFYFPAGRWLGVPAAQQSYIAANYTHAVRYVLDRGVNIVAQLVARRLGDDGTTRYSLSSNPDITLDLLTARRAGQADFLLVGQVNDELPFMPGEADLPAADFAHMLVGEAVQFPLFAPPKTPVSLSDYAIGLHVARLIPDGGTLQIGIGSIGDAIARALILRQHENQPFQELLTRLPRPERAPPDDHTAPFVTGLHGSSEMLVDGFLHLMQAGVLKREAAGAVLHAAFFLGSRDFYRTLRELPEAQRAQIHMCAVSYVNELYGDEAGKRQARTGARFVNKTMQVTLLGAAVSDTLPDGRVVSGVGGQYNFVAQAFALPDARSVLVLDATRLTGGRSASNIVWSASPETIPRHLRDIVVTEYGAADLRGRSDEDVIMALLAITDARFQDDLLRQARDAGKVSRHAQIPTAARENTPQHIQLALGEALADGRLPAFPFGTDFTQVEQRLIPVLARLRDAANSRRRLLHLGLRGLLAGRPDANAAGCLRRMGLDAPQGLTERAYRAVLRGALATMNAPF